MEEAVMAFPKHDYQIFKTLLKHYNKFTLTLFIPAPKTIAGKDQRVNVERTMLTFSRYLYCV